MSTFWERKIAEIRKTEQQTAPAVQALPWWAEGSNIMSRTATVPQQLPADAVPDAKHDGIRYIDGHDISAAQVLQGRAFECPMCPINPKTGVRGDMVRPAPSAALRCFDCGYIEDNRFYSQTAGMAAVTEGPAHRAKQTVSGGGGSKSNFHGDAKGDVIVVGRIG